MAEQNTVNYSREILKSQIEKLIKIQEEVFQEGHWDVYLKTTEEIYYFTKELRKNLSQL